MTDIAADPADVPKLLTVAEGFCVRQAIDNIAWIDLGEFGLVVDALEQPELEEEVFASIGATLGEKPVRYLINTHTHYDHVALNEAFQRRHHATVINAADDLDRAGGNPVRRFQAPSAGASHAGLPHGRGPGGLG